MAEYEMWVSTDIPINEELPQYRATESYSKKDSQQVNLTEGQTVSVIERCDTGKCERLPGVRTQCKNNLSIKDNLYGSSIHWVHTIP